MKKSSLPKQIDGKGMPIIRGAKVKEKKVSYSHFHISKHEEKILLDKYKREMPYDKAKQKLKNICNKLQQVYEKLKKKNVPKENIEMKLKEEIVRYY